MVKIGTQGTDADHKGGGGGIEKAGNYHLLVEKFEDFSQSDNPSVKLQFTVLAGDHQDQVGRKHTETFWFTGRDEKGTISAQNRAMELACALGLYSKQQWRADIEAGADADIPFENAEGRQLCAPVEMREYKGDKEQYRGKSFASLGFKFWAVGDPESDRVAKDAEYLNLLGGPTLPTKEGTRRVPGTKDAGAAAQPAAPKQPARPASPPPASAGFGSNF